MRKIEVPTRSVPEFELLHLPADIQQRREEREAREKEEVVQKQREEEARREEARKEETHSKVWRSACGQQTHITATSLTTASGHSLVDQQLWTSSHR